MMNEIYSKVWNKSLGMLVVASELASANGKSSSKRLRAASASLAVGLMMATGAAHAGITPCNTVLLPGPASTATGTDAIACGAFASAGGTNSVAIGTSALASGTDSIAMGNSAAVGTGAVPVNYGVAMGGHATVTGSNGVAIGESATAAVSATATGATAAAGNDSVANGYGASAGIINTGRDGTPFGDGNGSGVAVGSAAQTNGTMSTAVGANARSSEYAVAIGGGNSSSNSAVAGQRSVAVGSDAGAYDHGNVAVGNHAKAGTLTTPSTDDPYNTALGYSAKASGGQSTATGGKAVATGAQSTALGGNALVSVNGAVALGVNSTASVANTVSVGHNAADINPTTSAAYGTVLTRKITNVSAGDVTATSTDAVNGSQLFAAAAAAATHYYSVNDGGTQLVNFNNNGATASSALAAGVGASATGSSSTAMGNGAQALALKAVAIGYGAAANSGTSLALGSQAMTLGGDEVSMGTWAGLTSAAVQAAGDAAYPSGLNHLGEINIGSNAGKDVAGYQNVNVGGGAGQVSSGIRNTAVGDRAGSTVKGDGNTALGSRAGNNVTGSANIAIGQTAGRYIAANNSISVGTGALASANNATALGGGTADVVSGTVLTPGAQASAAGALALGGNATAGASAQGINSVAIGGQSVATNANDIAIGAGARATGGNSIAIGTGNVVSGASSGAFGDPNTIGGSDSYAVGNNNTIANNNTFVMGNGVTTSHDNGVVLGNASADRAATTVTGDTIDGTAYTYAGAGSPANGVVSVGAAKKERQLVNVAAGDVSGNSTDAINGSQLFATNTAVTAMGTRVTTLGNSAAAGMGGTSSYNAGTGTLTTALSVGGSNYTNVNDALSAVNTTASKGFNVTTAKAGTGTVTGSSVSNVAPGGTVTYTAGDNIALAQKGNDVTVTTNPDVAFTRVTTGATVMSTAGVAVGPNVLLGSTGLTIAGGPSVTTAGVDAGGKVITNVAAGVAATDGVNVSQLTGAVAANKTKYYSVNSVGGGNENNDGATGTDAIASGKNAAAAGNNSVALGQGAMSNNPSDVALGSNSVTSTANATATGAINGITYTYAGGAPTSVVSVGALGSERQITNVAAGQVTGGSTDAINGSQLYATDQALQAATMTANNAVQYDNAGKTSVTLGGVSAVTPVALTNVAPGALTNTSTDAVNGSQLNTTNQSVATNTTNIAGNTTSITNLGNQVTTIYNTGTKYFHANSTGTDSNPIGVDSIAIGQGAVSNNANDVALGSNSVTSTANATPSGTINGVVYAYAGATPTSVVSMGALGSERQITNVAAGEVSGSSTDTVNGSQLFATNTAVTAVGTRVTNLGNSTAAGLGGTSSYNAGTGTVTTGLSVGGNNYTNVNDALSAVNTVAGQGWNVTTAAIGSGVANGSSVAKVAPGATATITADNNIITTQSSTSVAIGVNPVLTGLTSVALTAGPSLSALGINMGGTTISNLAPGVNPTDAVNVSQLNIVAAGGAAHYFSVSDNGVHGGNYFNSGATGINSVAIGPNALADTDNSVALGNGALTAAAVVASNAVIGGTTYSFAGATPVGVVSVGSAHNERQITNVAAGQLSTSSTDAVNGSQLFATNTAVTTVATRVTNLGNSTAAGLGGTSSYNPSTGAVTTGLSVGGNNYTNVNDALSAVNTVAGQGWNVTTAAVGSGVANGSSVANVAPGATATITADNNIITTQTSTSVAIGLNPVLTGLTSIALTAGPSLSAAGVDMSGTTISNLAPGVNSGDAVNVSQLNTVVDGAKVEYVSINSTGAGNRLNDGATGDNSIAIGAGNVVSGVNSGAIGDPNTVTGNGSYAFGNNNNIAANNAFAIGNDITVAKGLDGAVAIGNGSTVDLASVASYQPVGGPAVVGVAIGANVVSVGSSGSERRLTNVAAGGAPTDAVNVSQLKASQAGDVRYDSNADGSANYNSVTMNPGGDPTVVHNVGAGVANNDAVNVGQLNSGLQNVQSWAKSYTDQSVNNLGRQAFGGVASAIAVASLPQAYQANQSSAGVALGNFHGQSGIAVGVSTISESGRYIFKLNASTDTRGDTGVGVGAGIVW